MKEKIFEYIRNQYGADPEYLWEKFPDYAIFRHADNKKWFALVASIGRDKLGLDGKGYIDVINLKINDPMLQDELIHENGIFLNDMINVFEEMLKAKRSLLSSGNGWQC